MTLQVITIFILFSFTQLPTICSWYSFCNSEQYNLLFWFWFLFHGLRQGCSKHQPHAINLLGTSNGNLKDITARKQSNVSCHVIGSKQLWSPEYPGGFAWNSPNTDRLHMQNVKHVNITNNAFRSGKTFVKIYLKVDIFSECKQGIPQFVTRVRFKQMNMDLHRKCMDHVKKCLRDAKIDKSSFHDVVLENDRHGFLKWNNCCRISLTGKNSATLLFRLSLTLYIYGVQINLYH